MSGKLFRRCFAAKPAAKVIADYESYEAIKTTGTKMMVGYFTASWSAASKLYEPKFDELAASYPNYTFYKVDVDAVPKAAFDKTDLKVLSAPDAEYQQVVPRAKEAIDSIKFGEGDVERLPWKYDPATGTSLPAHQTS